MSLGEYRKKRRFRRTPEPEGKKTGKTGWQYVIQKHQASHLHYDFRLEWEGVLKSWAIPKGPSLEPRQRRLAVEVEDHPLEYADFEGTIPEPEYGAGDVIVWDRGTWQPDNDPKAGFREGKLTFHLQGEKLHGGWALIRGRPRSGKNMWYLIKARDKEARSEGDANIVEEMPQSVISGQTVEEIEGTKKRRTSSKSAKKAVLSRSARVAHPPKRILANSRSAAKSSVTGKRKPATAKRAVSAAKRQSKRKPAALTDMAEAMPAELPEIFRPQLATLVKDPPMGQEWWHETKFDGNRLGCRIAGKKVEFFSRNMKSWTDRLPHLVEAAQKLPAEQALLDGELVAMRADGTTNFEDLQNAFRENRAAELLYFVFDLLYLDGYDLTSVPLSRRKEALASILSAAKEDAGPIRYTKHIAGEGPQCFESACHRKQEGIISKNSHAKYLPGRGYDWLKIKCIHREEFIIGGYTDPQKSREAFGSLLLGYYDKGKKLAIP